MLQLSFRLFDVIVVAGILQALVTAVVLILYPAKNPVRTLFAAILLTLAALSFKILLHTLNLWELPPFRYFPLGIDTLLPPLLYLYVLSVTGSPVGKSKVFFCLSPALVFMIYAIVVYAITLPQPALLAKDQLASSLLFNPVKTAEDLIAVISGIIYWILGLRRLSRYRQWLYSSQSDTSLQEYAWLKNILVLSGILIVALAVIVTIEDMFSAGHYNFICLQLFYSYLAIISYYLSFKGYMLYGAFPRVTVAGPAAVEVEHDLTLTPLAAEMNGEYLVIKEKILYSLETEQLYLNADLSLRDMAKHLGYPTAVVSAVINQGFQLNFRNLINKYRVEEVKRKLLNPPRHLSLLGIALDCGFNSEASFYRIFRQETGLSPRGFLKTPKTDH